MKAYWLLPFCLTLAMSAALAQTAKYASIEATAGASLRVGYYASAKKDCSPSPLSKVRVLSAPKHGVLSVQAGILSTNRIKGCPNLRLPVQMVLYLSHSGYVGTDALSYEITSGDGRSEVYHITLDVRSAQKPNGRKPPPDIRI